MLPLGCNDNVIKHGNKETKEQPYKNLCGSTVCLHPWSEEDQYQYETKNEES